ncbi:CRISPR-associated helicase Cas3' [Kutzneria sp. NPDC052558]|uniref:CRISPR-associated helicase Cas3' n=1 Tax=Kutzneria sp. NPDC052558 TaxID=3364121 RepID=UPI0037CCACDB
MRTATTAWLSAWAKSTTDDHGAVTHWLPLHQHLADAGGVAGLLVDTWVSPQVIRRLARDFPGGEEDVRAAACWLAATHDVAKASPAFSVQVPVLADLMRSNGLRTSPLLRHDPARRSAPHALVGHDVVATWLVRELGFTQERAQQWAVVVGGHHGVPPAPMDLAAVRGRIELIGAGEWDVAREMLLGQATEVVGGKAVLARFAGVALSRPSQALLSAIVILADWIASNTELFPLLPISTIEQPLPVPDEKVTAARLARAWARLGLPSRWVPEQLHDDLDQVFRDRFDVPQDASARPVQVAAVAAARAQEVAGLVVVEAPMGAGKTEAALLAAEQLAAVSGADGCFVALPTQATTDAMFGRILPWLKRLPGLPAGATSVYLAHGKASLNDDFQGLVRAGRSVGVDIVDGCDTNSLVAHEWLFGRKKGALASFVVGTIDQVLFAGLKSRHLALRHLALAGKVVIIDEAHAYDVYMSQYLDRVLHWLGAYGVPVVLLSATLPPSRRAALLDAYASGADQQSETPDVVGYPVVSGTGGIRPQPIATIDEPTPVALKRVDDDLDTLVTWLRARLAGGGCAVVVRNTVGRVQEAAARLEAEFGADAVTVAHAQFLACDRAARDLDLLRCFGPPGPARERPPLHIVVASQVVEQSLDVDFDLMVTDLAPIDLLLQRLGRLHRHDRERPVLLQEPVCAVVGVQEWNDAPVRAVPGSRRVYEEHLLLRTAAVLPADGAAVALPNDIPTLVSQVYGDEVLGPPTWQAAMTQAREAADNATRDRIANAQSFLLAKVGKDTESLVDWLRGGIGDVDDDHKGMARVRDGEESLEVLVVQRDGTDGLRTPDWIPDGGVPIPVDLAMPAEQARVIASCALRLPYALCHRAVVADVISALEVNQFTSFQQSPQLAGQLVLVFDEDRSALIHHGTACFTLTYDPRRGLLHERG